MSTTSSLHRPVEMAQSARSSWRTYGTAVIVVAATYVYFLIFAEFALLELAGRFVTSGYSTRMSMGALGGGGVLGCILAARKFQAAHFKRLLWLGYILTGVAAACALLVANPVGFVVSVASVGTSLGWLTVVVASGLRSVVGGGRLGLCCGLGTGAAYALCNLPAVFLASATVQTGIALVACALGAAATFGLKSVPVEMPQTRNYRLPVSLLWGAVFLTLVWVDSAAFYIIQHTPELKAQTWGNAALLLGNVGTHLGAAVVAGWWLDRGYMRGLLGLAAGLLVTACVCLQRLEWAVYSPILYTAGVSIYSTALVFYPAAGGRAFLAGIFYAVVGWGGSALGIGMAQDLRHIPVWFLCVAAAVVAVSCVRIGRQKSAVMLFVLLLVVCARGEDTDPRIARGRAVYISEGCIHCHSQYVRPQVAREVIQWGPAVNFETAIAGEPPLLGNRRQGPDLSRVGNRRSPDWQRLHLLDPQVLHPGSRMPSYAYLFAKDGARGWDLVAYLDSLGAESFAERTQFIETWRPDITGASEVGKLEHGERVFRQLCAACHGETGQGNGPLVAQLWMKPPDWVGQGWRRVRADDPELELRLSRIVKFGWPGTAMAGHEYLDDPSVVALAKYVMTLQKK